MMTEVTTEAQTPSPGSSPRKTSERHRIGRIIHGLFTGIVLFGNLLFLVLIIHFFILLASGQGRGPVEEVLIPGPEEHTIAILDVDGIIGNSMVEDLRRWLRHARDDPRVKALVVRIHSPGGTIAASDAIHHEIHRYRQDTNEPVVRYLHGIAASGGYYISVARDRIVAEPTTLTGSIGVIFDYLVVNELLQQKLGIQPVVLKDGEHKDWPSPFRQPSDAERDYIQARILDPAHRRFVSGS